MGNVSYSFVCSKNKALNKRIRHTKLQKRFDFFFCLRFIMSLILKSGIRIKQPLTPEKMKPFINIHIK